LHPGGEPRAATVEEGATGLKKSAPGDQRFVDASSPEVEGEPPGRFPGEDEGAGTTIGELLQEQCGSAEEHQTACS